LYLLSASVLLDPSLLLGASLLFGGISFVVIGDSGGKKLIALKKGSR